MIALQKAATAVRMRPPGWMSSAHIPLFTKGASFRIMLAGPDSLKCVNKKKSSENVFECALFRITDANFRGGNLCDLKGCALMA